MEPAYKRSRYVLRERASERQMEADCKSVLAKAGA